MKTCGAYLVMIPKAAAVELLACCSGLSAHLDASPFKVAGPADVGVLVKPRLELDQSCDRLAGFGGVNQRTHDRAVVGGAVKGLLDRQHIRIACCLKQELHHRIKRLIGVVDDERAGTSSPTLMRSRRLTLSWEVVNTTRIAAGLTIAMASATLLVPDSIQMQKSVFVSSEALATANGWDAYGSLRSVDADLAIGCDALKPRESELFFQLLVQLLDVHNTDMKKMRETAYLADDGGAMQVQFD